MDHQDWPDRKKFFFFLKLLTKKNICKKTKMFILIWKVDTVSLLFWPKPDCLFVRDGIFFFGWTICILDVQAEAKCDEEALQES